jgi:lipid-binding SYLF domain-containing protein
MEAGREAAPVFSYVKSRGLYAGVSILGQVFVGKQQFHKIAEGECISVLISTI